MPDPNAVVAPAPGVPAGEPNKPVVVAPGSAVTAAWRESFEDVDVKGSASLDKFKGKDDREILGAVSKAYVNLEKMPRGVTPPADDAPKEAWDKFYSAIGRPATAEEYGIDIKAPEGLPWSKPAEKLMLKQAHDLGLTSKQAKGLIDTYLKTAVEGQTFLKQHAAEETEQHYEAIRKEWGGLTDVNVALVQRCVSEFGGEEFKNYLDLTNLGNDPRFLKFVHAMGSPMVEKNLIKGENLGMKHAEAKAEIDRLMATKEWREGDKATIEKIRDLTPLAYPDNN